MKYRSMTPRRGSCLRQFRGIVARDAPRRRSGEGSRSDPGRVEGREGKRREGGRSGKRELRRKK